MLSKKIREAFLSYFEKKGHTRLPSSPVVPHNDPTLLFANAGMNQFKDVFLGTSKRDYTRATTTQKCVRVGGKHNDLDNVGHTTRHLTFFEMLGNFSFGDYFKEEAIDFAWELTLNGFGFDPKKLWITIYEEDDEAEKFWLKHVKKERIVRMGAKDNYWEMGDLGPCGPCTELYYDRGEKYGHFTSPLDDPHGERFFEFWNLVFMQFNKLPGGKIEKLPNPCVDAGAGLERIVSLKMDVDTVFGTDILMALIHEVENIAKMKYDPKGKKAPAFHVIADHIRSLSFAIADGAQPSNLDRGYVLRKILRRAVRYGRNLGLNDPFLGQLVPTLIKTMGEDFPEIAQSKERIEEILTIEEEAFLRTLHRGGNILSTVIEAAEKKREKQISGEDAFKLKDTYGFPLEEILLIAKDSNLEVNLEQYALLEEKAKELSRKAHVSGAVAAQENLFDGFTEKNGKSQFTGYTDIEGKGKVLALLQNGTFTEKLSEGDEGAVILSSTPFYAEKGGQVGDMGTLASKQGEFQVKNCTTPYPDVILHIGKVEKGSIKVGETLIAEIDVARRGRIAANHSATHLLHWALQRVFGEQIRQAGSLVDPTRLRFDFNHHKAPTQEDIWELERLVNEKIRTNRKIDTYELNFQDVQKRGDIKQFFGDKYGAKVRVVDIDFSKELCGGTHVKELGVIGYFRIAKEGSIAQGVRRIEAVTGLEAEEFVRKEELRLHDTAQALQTTPQKLLERSRALMEENKALAKELKILKRSQLKSVADQYKEKITASGKFSSLIAFLPVSLSELPEIADLLLENQNSLFLMLAAKGEGKCNLLARATGDLVQKGVHCGKIIKELAPYIGGGGGGKPDSAGAGGTNPDGIEKALEGARAIISK